MKSSPVRATGSSVMFPKFEGEVLRAFGGLRPLPSPGRTPQRRRLTFAGGGPPLTCTALRAARRKCRYGLLREGKGRRCERYRRTRHYRPQAGKKRNECLYGLSKRDTRERVPQAGSDRLCPPMWPRPDHTNPPCLRSG
jgi:hypothetical protein